MEVDGLSGSAGEGVAGLEPVGQAVLVIPAAGSEAPAVAVVAGNAVAVVIVEVAEAGSLPGLVLGGTMKSTYSFVFINRRIRFSSLCSMRKGRSIILCRDDKARLRIREIASRGTVPRERRALYLAPRCGCGDSRGT